MSWKAVSAIVISLLVVSDTLVSTFNNQPVRAGGILYINAEGSIDPRARGGNRE